MVKCLQFGRYKYSSLWLYSLLYLGVLQKGHNLGDILVSHVEHTLVVTIE